MATAQADRTHARCSTSHDAVAAEALAILHRVGRTVSDAELRYQMRDIATEADVTAAFGQLERDRDAVRGDGGWRVAHPVAEETAAGGPARRRDLTLIAGAGIVDEAAAGDAESGVVADEPSPVMSRERRTRLDDDAVRRALRRAPASQRALVDHAGMSRFRVKRALERLAAAGEAHRTDRTVHDWPGSGMGAPSPVWEALSDLAAGATGEPRAARPLADASADAKAEPSVGEQLIAALAMFGVRGQVIHTFAGPHITRFELELAPGTKMQQFARLKDDLAYALAATEIRMLAPVPGKRLVGVEIPNATRKLVRLRDIAGEPPAENSPLTVWIGEDVSGQPLSVDLAQMPHLLVAGTTGAGKSAGLNAMLASILLHASPQQVRLVLVDTKMVELSRFGALPHLLSPVITDADYAVEALEGLVDEMERRYEDMAAAGVRSLPELNATRVAGGDEPLPYLLCVVDEFADLMMVGGDGVEDTIVRLAQKSRAVGLHLVIATQSPRVAVVTGLIKANVPSRLAYTCASMTDSRVVLDRNGAEELLGQGDLLFLPIGSPQPQRVQGAFIDSAELDVLIADVVERYPAAVMQDLGRLPTTDVDAIAPADERGGDVDGEDLDAIGQVDADREADEVQRAGDEQEIVEPSARSAAAAAIAPVAVATVANRTLDDITRAAGGVRDLLGREDFDALQGAAEAVLTARYLNALLRAIEQGDTTPALLDRYERLMGLG